MNIPKEVVALDVEYQPGPVPNPTHIAIVNYEGNPIFDMYFKPLDGTILSTKKMAHLKGRGMWLYAAFKPIIKTILKDKIIVGHDLNHDFKALGLKISNYEIIDIAFMKKYMKTIYTPRKLKNLARNYLNEEIQEDTIHSALEDAQTAMKLIKLYNKNIAKNNRQNLLDIIEPRRGNTMQNLYNFFSHGENVNQENNYNYTQNLETINWKALQSNTGRSNTNNRKTLNKRGVIKRAINKIKKTFKKTKARV
jgi:hypothetical protein